MPTAALKPCAGGCGELVRRGRCTSCSSTGQKRRRESRPFTYSELWWRSWRETFVGTLVNAGIVPICGASLRGPSRASQCAANGLETWASRDGTGLHLHHDPELTEDEKARIANGERLIACDENRVALVCRSCHSIETGGAI